MSFESRCQFQAAAVCHKQISQSSSRWRRRKKKREGGGVGGGEVVEVVEEEPALCHSKVEDN